MKPDKTICEYCGKDLLGRADRRFCSEAHRKAFVRHNGLNADINRTEGGQIKPDKQIEGVEKHGVLPEENKADKLDSLTPTDKTFYDRAIRDFGYPYYKFGGPLHEETCIMQSCGKTFKTGLSLLRYCSYEHYTQSLAGRK